jgi:hypothetical protein
MASSSDNLSWSGLFARFLFALLLVYATWNPWGKSFTHWVILPLFGAGTGEASANGPIKFLLGIALVIGWVVYIQATRRSLGLTGALLVAAICGGVVWLLTTWKVVAMQGAALAHVILLCIAILLSIGMSWSHISRRMSGQVDTDSVD